MFIKFILFAFLIVLVIAGCATAPTVAPPIGYQQPGIYHKVASGETLWRISKIYDVDLDRLVMTNRIPDASVIEKGQMIFIPGTSVEKREMTPASIANFSWPIKGKILAYFGSVSSNRKNKGIDIQIKPADSVYSSFRGKVTFCDYLKGYGNTIIIEHPEEITTVYAGDLKTAIKLNDWVDTGTKIAQYATGSSSKQGVLHFEVRRGYKSQNPLYYLP